MRRRKFGKVKSAMDRALSSCDKGRNTDEEADNNPETKNSSPDIYFV